MAVNSISRNLNKSINLSKVLISSSSRYSIYKVQWSCWLAFARLELFYSIITSSVCQVLFSKFFNFFQSPWQSSLLRSAALAGSPLILAHLVPFVKNFFHFFSNFFEPLLSRRSFRSSFSIISHSVSFVKYFFQAFSSPFQHPTSYRSDMIFRRRFCGNQNSLAHPRPFVKPIFQLFSLISDLSSEHPNAFTPGSVFSIPFRRPSRTASIY